MLSPYPYISKCLHKTPYEHKTDPSAKALIPQSHLYRVKTSREERERTRTCLKSHWNFNLYPLVPGSRYDQLGAAQTGSRSPGHKVRRQPTSRTRADRLKSRVGTGDLLARRRSCVSRSELGVSARARIHLVKRGSQKSLLRSKYVKSALKTAAPSVLRWCPGPRRSDSTRGSSTCGVDLS